MENYIQTGGGASYSYPIQNLLQTNTDTAIMTGGGGERNYAAYDNFAIPMGLINEAFGHNLQSWKRCESAGAINDELFDNLFSAISERGSVPRNVSKKEKPLNQRKTKKNN